jgi:uncharacterized protein YjbI with pentapeptide repeats
VNTRALEMFHRLSSNTALLSSLRAACQTLSPDEEPPKIASLLKPHHALLLEAGQWPENEEVYRDLFKLITGELSGQDLTGADLSHLNLDGYTFFHANLASARLYRASLKEATFAHANLSGADLHAVVANLADFSDANLTNAHLSEGQFLHASFRRAQMQRSNVSAANLTGADLNRADLTEAKAVRTMARWAIISGADLSRSVWSSANLTGADLSWATMNSVQLAGSQADHATFAWASMKNADLAGISLRHASLHQSDLEGANLSRGTLSFCSLVEANLKGTNLQGIRAPYAVFNAAMFAPTTVIEGSSHDLLAALLESTAETFEEHMFAAVVRSRRDYCWREFTEELRQRPALVPWIEQTLSPYPSLAPDLRSARTDLEKKSEA